MDLNQTLPFQLPRMLTVMLLAVLFALPANAAAADEAAVRRAVDRGLAYLVSAQARNGRWEAEGGLYPVAMTALGGMALLMDGNTTLQGRYATNVQSAVGYLLDQVQPNGLIGHPTLDSRYMYGHGFSMLFLSQILGEEEDIVRRRRLVETLTAAVEFSGKAQTIDGGWGYVTAREGRGFDEGSVTITQMQGLRSARNAGIPVPKEIIEKGIEYIERCTGPDGGVRYSLKTSGGSRPPITAAAIACLFSAGEHDNPLVKKLSEYADRTLSPDNRSDSYGHWHYAHYYYAQVVYRQGGEKWASYSKTIFDRLLEQQAADGSWSEGYIGGIYTTALNLTILQLDNGYLPIYQR